MQNYRCNMPRNMSVPQNNSYNATHPQDSLSCLPIAMAYVPWQKWECIYDLEKGFCRGTIFEKLDKPFLGKGGAR